MLMGCRVVGTRQDACAWRIAKSCGKSAPARNLARYRGRVTVSVMRDILLLAIHLLTTLVNLLRPSGPRAIVAESLILKHQLLILNRSRRRAPHLTVRDRLLLGLATLVVNPKRLCNLATGVAPDPRVALGNSSQQSSR